MNRAELIKLAKIRLKEAEILLNNRSWSGAYYLCGYVIECGLKASIAKKTHKSEFPDKERVNASYVHDLEKLIGVAELKLEKEKKEREDLEFSTNWAVVKEWSEKSRYRERSEKEAHDLFFAVSDKLHGVLQWLQQHW
jgi:hypothetical protein